MLGTDYLSNPLVFLVKTLFGLYILAVLLRFLLQQSRADFYNPVSQFLVKITQPVLRPLRRVVPGIAGVDVAALVLLLALQLLELALVGLIQGGALMPLLPMLVIAVAELVDLTLNVYLVVIFVQVILSWVQPGYNPATAVIYSLTEPVLRPARRIIPPLGGLDLSPLLVIILIQLLKMLALPPLYGLARAAW
jgi:YggT family protein